MGSADQSKPATAATCGVAMDMPWRYPTGTAGAKALIDMVAVIANDAAGLKLLPLLLLLLLVEGIAMLLLLLLLLVVAGMRC